MATPVESVRDISRIAYGFMSSRALFAAIEVGLFTRLAQRQATVGELADELGLVPDALRTLLSVLEAEGLVAADHGRYCNSPAAQRFLVRGAPEDYSEYLRLQVGGQVYGQLPASVAGLRGDSGSMVTEGMEGWFTDAREADVFTRAQHAGSMGPARQLAKRFALGEECRSMIDVAGGSGAFSITFCSMNPQLRSTVIDFPAVIDVARRFVAESSLSDRIDLVAGNALEVAWPADADLVLMSYLLSAVEASRHADLFRLARRSLRPGGRLIIHDFMLDDDRSGPLGAAQWFFAYLPSARGAASFSAQDVADGVAAAGFRDTVAESFIPGLTKVVAAVA